MIATHPYATPLTLRLVGIRWSQYLTRIGGIVTVGLGGWILWIAYHLLG